MLEQLTIRGLALIESATVAPSTALTVISGETGGGKSLVIGALRLLRGEKARASFVRKGAKAATIDGVFALEAGERSNLVRELYAEVLGLPAEEDRIVVSRIVEETGKSRARIDGRPVPIRELKRFGELLIEIHGQGENRSLMRPEIQTELVDAFCGKTEARVRFARELTLARAVRSELENARSKSRERRDRIDYLRHCLGEFERLALERGERAELERKAKIFGSLAHLRDTLGQSLDQLRDSEDDAILDRLRRILRETEALVSLDDRLEAPVRMLDEAAILVEEAAHELAAGSERLDLDPREEATTRARLDDVERLFDRFGPSEDDVFESRDVMTTELEHLLDESRSPDALEAKLAELETGLDALAIDLTTQRRRASKKLSGLMVRELADLSMSNVRVEVRVVEREGASILERATALGTSEVEVFVAPNPGEPMTALHETASGGEVARVMLVLKKILADADCVPILVFDEADAEIGGRLGMQVGRKLKDVAKAHQVLCVTHLPQIAAFADMHCLVSKRVEKGRTVARLDVLEGAARERELASMARGDRVDPEALEEASRLIDLARGEA